MNHTRTRALVGVLAASALLAGCSGAGQQASPSPSPSGGVPSSTASVGTPTPTSTASATPSGADDPALRPYYEQKVAWDDCSDGFQCAKVLVPLDYQRPDAGHIQLALVRLPALESKGRIGSLFTNPGGPGGSGIDFLRNAATTTFTESVRRGFDLIGFDPRGVGQSTPLDCLTDRQTDAFLATDGSPDNQAEIARLVAESKLLSTGCSRDNAALMAHMSTMEVARDLDVMRAVVGDKKLNYLGYSYGTAIGADYADLFPTRINRMVLDGAMDPGLTPQQINLGQTEGFERALTAFIADCAKRADCPLPHDPKAARARMAQFLKNVDAHPLRSMDGSGRQVTQSLVVTGILAPLYDNSYWPYLRQALSAAFAGDGTALLAMVDLYTDRDPSGHYTSNSNEAIYAVNCLDAGGTGGITGAEQQAKQLTQISPLFGSYLAWSSLPCDYWPVKPVGGPREVKAQGAPPIVVVGTTRDPATPYEWARALARQLSSGVLLTWEGDGHTAYGRPGGSTCIRQAVDTYLLEGKPPAADTHCA